MAKMKPIIQLTAKTPQAQANIEDIVKDIRIILPAFDVEVVNLVSTREEPARHSIITNLTPVSENVDKSTIPLCECEHGSHFDEHPEMNHAYALTFEHDPDAIVETKTPYGVFKLCRDCRDAKHMEVK